ncbi:hypothetical protein L1987_54371 [Smallanthus sonchifolius]|uniref:Uncharacterized protein n=1 Tax=Smallanthus sonchifolius TaxID=185202 RepID=A0ACB9E6I2_9ASTR|nr:hypothetical protein L1987_54371 [Smallanthus sonchifolius]
MEHKGRIASPVFFFTLLCVHCMIDCVKARRSIQEQGVVGQVDLCAGIVGPSWNVTKQRKSPCPTLVVWVPKKPGFTEFVKVNERNEVEGGFSIDVFCHAIQLLPFNVRPIFKPFVNKKG